MGERPEESPPRERQKKIHLSHKQKRRQRRGRQCLSRKWMEGKTLKNLQRASRLTPHHLRSRRKTQLRIWPLKRRINYGLPTGSVGSLDLCRREATNSQLCTTALT